MTVITSRQLNQDVSAAKRAAADGPVVVTDRGEPSFVLMTIDDYHRIVRAGANDFLARLRMSEDIELDVAPLDLLPRVPDL